MAVGFVYVGICILVLNNVARGHIPMTDEFLAEPNYASYESTYSDEKTDNSLERLTALRGFMEQYGVDAYIVPTADAHNSQYISATDARRVWLTGLQGSSGTAVVTAAEARVWTDGRYFTQFDMQVNTTYFTLMRQGIDPSIANWLASEMEPLSVVGVDPTTYTRNSWTSLERTLNEANITLSAIGPNLVDLARDSIGDPAPPRPNNPLIVLDVTYNGNPSSAKLTELRRQMTERGASVLILTALDDIAYTLNIRGSDILYNPVFFSYLIIRNDVPAPNNLMLFWGNGTLSPEVFQHLASEGTQLTTKPYEEIFDYIAEDLLNDITDGTTIWMSQDASHAIYLSVEYNGRANILSTMSPVALIKCIKNEIELAGFRSAHIKDGIAVVRGLRWVEEQVAAGEAISEMDLSNKLRDLRSEEADSQGPSFSTIAGAGSNGAVIHYSPPEVGSRIIGRHDMLLVDSGGQYKDGTTDITRTRHMSASPTPAQKHAFTLVMKGQISLGTAVFPPRTLGHAMEILARKALWDAGLNYAHGTGHGVGHFLNVHEGPAWILSGPVAGDPGIVAGMVFSNEPGYYEVNEYGIRHEDLVEVIELTPNTDHIMAKGLVGNFTGAGALTFRYLSLVPHQTACLDVDLLTDFEIKFLNEYHARVLDTLGPILQERNLLEDYAWLEKECAPIGSAAILMLSPILLLSVFSLWFTS